MIGSAYSVADFAVLAAAAFLVGMRRGGLNGAAVIGVVLLATRFPAALAVGIGVPIFLYADIQATVILFRDVDWPVLGRLLVPTLVGLVVGAFLGRLLVGPLFDWVLFGIVVLAYGSLVVQRIRHDPAAEIVVPRFLTPVMGFLSGFTSMIGNLASIFVAIYFAATGTRKAQFIATSVWFFFMLNVIKLPIHLFVWRTVEPRQIVPTLVLIPVVTLGIWLGRVIVARLSEERYLRLVVVVAGLAIARYFYGLVVHSG